MSAYTRELVRVITLLCVAVPIAYHLRNERKLGSVQFRLDAPRLYKIIMIIGIGFSTIGILLTTISAITWGWKPDRLSSLLTMFTVMFFLILGARGPWFEVRRDGICIRGRFLKWQQVKAYTWKKSDPYQPKEEKYLLGLKIEDDPFTNWIETWKFSAEQKETIDELLAPRFPELEPGNRLSEMPPHRFA